MATRVAAAAVVAAVTLVPAPGVAGPRAPAARDPGAAAIIERYQARIPELMAQQHIPGLALAVVDGDRVVWQQGFGHTGGAHSRPVTADTLFSVQSTSKVFTATAVMQAVQAGQLDLDVPITTYLPGFTVHSAFEPHPERKITLRMLLSHTAGFTHEAPLGNNYEPEPATFDAHVRTISDTWLRFPVGTGFAYSNLGVDLAGAILERVWQEPFPALMHDGLLGPLGMDHSTFDRAKVRASADRALGHSDWLAAEPVDIPMTAAGGLWTSAADMATFLRFQLGNGTLGGRTVLAPPLMQAMRTVPAPYAGAPAGYALGVARTRWRAVQYLDLFSHGGGGWGFLCDLWWLPQLQLGITVLTSSDTHHLQGDLAIGILHDLVTEPGSAYRERLRHLPNQSDVVEPDSRFVPPPDLAGRIATLALPASRDQARRWAGYTGLYRTGEIGAMTPTDPPSRFHVDSGVPYFDAAEDGTAVRHALAEFQPGLFLADDGETLDLAGPSPRWRGIDLHRVTGGPLAWQWLLLASVAAVAAWWLVGTVVDGVRRRRGVDPSAGRADRAPLRAHGWRELVTVVAVAGACTALLVVVGIRIIPGFVDVGFLGRMALPIVLRLALHLPLAVAVLAVALGVLLVAGAGRGWWTPRVPRREAALAVALAALAAQLAAWHLVAWGF